MIKFLVTFFFGMFGVHKFLEGNKKMGFVYLFTLGLFSFGWMYDSLIAFIDVFRPLTTQNDSNPTNMLLHYRGLVNGHDFEHFIAHLLTRAGYQDVEVTSGSGDQGVDVLATNGDIKYVFQCKLYSGKVSNDAVQQIAAGRLHYNAHVGIVATNSQFTTGARELAASNSVILWDGNYIETLINQLT